MFGKSAEILFENELGSEAVTALLTRVGFHDCAMAHRRLLEMSPDADSRAALSGCLPMLLIALSDAATPDGSLINFERFVQSVPDRTTLFRYLAANPRAVEILVRLFVGSQFLTEILIRNPRYLEELTNHKRVAEFKSQQDFVQQGEEAAAGYRTLPEKLDALRRSQHWELLRIGACDAFGLMDLKSVTIQLSLLADSLVQCCLKLIAEELDISPQDFAVLGMGKLGGEELNYSSDIDLIFLSDDDPMRFWTFGQKLIKALTEATGEGFLYRVDMRLRPWGKSGSLVNSVDAHIQYLAQHGMLWEKQALMKARVIAGDRAIARDFLKRAEALIYGAPVDLVRTTIRGMKQRIEAELDRQGRKWGEVKSGEGSIRDIEFVTQFLQLSYGATHREIRSISTLDGLVRLADMGFIHADEYRRLSTGYVFFRTIEHALQLMHYSQTHSLPTDHRELAYLARRLDFPDVDHFVRFYQQHREEVRAIYEKYLGERAGMEPEIAGDETAAAMPHIPIMGPTYRDTFTEEELHRHGELLKLLSDKNIVDVEAVPYDEGRWRLTVVGYDHIGDLSMMCGLMFVYGINIIGGYVFTAEHVETRASEKGSNRSRQARKFVNVFIVTPPEENPRPEFWLEYRNDLAKLLRLVEADKTKEAAGQLVKRVASAVSRLPAGPTVLYPVEIEIDNESSDKATVLHLRADDTIGFLYELANALSMTGIDIGRVIIGSIGNRVFDTLYVTDASGEKITDETRLKELRAAVVLIKHFTHLLPQSPNPEAALLHFRDFLQQLFEQDNWVEDLSTLERSDVLQALARLLGVSDFLWEDFLRLQHDNLFPVVKDVEALARRKTRADLKAELDALLAGTDDPHEKRAQLNAFKDREMFRTDMRHILGHITEFGHFSSELSDVADVVVTAATEICYSELTGRYGTPRVGGSQVSREPQGAVRRAVSSAVNAPTVRSCPFSVCAMGKCGGRELGFASDIELMFLFEDNGTTTGPEVITTNEFFQKLVELFTQTIAARREGIFQIDLRLRPYGRAGSLAVSHDAFRAYFGPNGAAWPYERQALVKLRPVAGDADFGRRMEALRDELIYTGEPFDVAAMRAMREKQVRQLVRAGTINVKLSYGGLVDCEYLVQGLQITNGKQHPEIRTTNTLEAMQALRSAGILPEEDYRRLHEGYTFERRLIDALRMVRGHARDLTVPPLESEEFDFLARRLGYADDPARLQRDIERNTERVQDLGRLLDAPS